MQQTLESLGLAKTLRQIQRNLLDGMVKNFPAIGLDKRAEEFVRHFKDFIPLNARVLDIGGGWGFYVEPLERLRQCEVTVLDVVQPGFQKAPVIVYGGETMPFPDGFFDISLLVTMLHHVPDPEKILKEARRVTRRFVIVIEDLYRTSWGRWWTILRDQIYNFEFVGHPCQFKKKEEWFQCFQKLGFGLESEKETYTSLLGMRILNGIFVLRV